MDINIGDWVIDSMGDYCKVQHIGKMGGNGDIDSVWGIWDKSHFDKELLYTDKDNIKMVCKYKYQAKALSAIISSIAEVEDDRY